MNVMIIAPSGGGKGTQAKLLSKDFGDIPQISTGDIFRKNIKEQTPLGLKAAEYVNNGIWVPDDLTTDMLLDRLAQDDCKKGFILDGYPRTLNQAKLLAEKVKMDVVIEIDLTNQTVLDRLKGRWTCKVCDEIHNSQYEDVTKCKKCESELYQREDDKEEKILLRLKQYRDQNKDILAFYKDNGMLITIQVKPEYFPPDVYALISAELKNKGIKK